ncbi:major facilitator superfamily domain-containing protein [Aspergillus cavernicola]|uniref:Major facilitator superfamily domain-containing protein n=1 Tax=Aspergillus cavernicola TaxID=176166 RepID=A0ABR4IJQ4_9EURO
MPKTASPETHPPDIEKPDAHHEETLGSVSPQEHKRLIRRIDMRLVLTLGCLYCISLLDRTNLGAASIAGMQTDLNMNALNNGYSVTSLVFFFITYTVFQIPATVIIRKLGPRIFLSAIVVLWGVIVIGFGLVPKWQSMAGLRVILGALEAGFYPGCVYLLSTWYPRYELQKRNAAFYLIGSMASGFGGILAYGLMQMDGGVLTCALGLGSYIFLVDFPEQSPKSWNFLNETEAAHIVSVLENDRSDVYAEGSHKVWLYTLLYLLTTANTYSIAYFLPIILQDSMGFDVAKAQCLVAPPYVAAGIVMFLQGMLADKWRVRGPIVAVNAVLGLLGLGLLGYLQSPAPRYFGVFLATIAGNSNCPALVSWQSNNIRGQWKRALTSATLIGGGSIGGILGTTVFRAQDAPDYHPGLLTTMVANGLIVLIVGLLGLKFSRANARADRGGKLIEGLSGFRYTL